MRISFKEAAVLYLHSFQEPIEIPVYTINMGHGSCKYRVTRRPSDCMNCLSFVGWKVACLGNSSMVQV